MEGAGHSWRRLRNIFTFLRRRAHNNGASSNAQLESLLPRVGSIDFSRARSKVLHNVPVLRVASLSRDDDEYVACNQWQAPHNGSKLGQEQRASIGQILYKACVRILPAVGWLSEYRVRESLRLDLIAGLTVGVMLAPQSMAYARTAGLDPEYGLYASVLPVFAYALFGSSREVSAGPVALTSFLVAQTLDGMVPHDWPEQQQKTRYVQLAAMLALMVGCLMLSAGLLRLGWVVRFLSHTILSAFSSAAAITIGLSQLHHWFEAQVPLPSWTWDLPLLLRQFLSVARSMNSASLLLGVSSFLFLLSLRRLAQQRKEYRQVAALGPLAAVTVGTTLVWATGLQVDTVGPVPQGLPSLTADWPMEEMHRLWISAVEIAGIACMESITVAKALAARNDYELDASQELVGLGLANLVASISGGFPVAGSFSRSLVNADAGARTGLAAGVSALAVLATLLSLTPLFLHLPMAVLASIVMVGVLGLVDFQEALFLYRVEKKELGLWILAFSGTLLFGVELGVLASVAVSLAFVVNETANPHHALLGRLDGTEDVYCDMRQYLEARPIPGIVLIRFDAPLYFANINFVKERLRKYTLCCRRLWDAQRSPFPTPVRFGVSSLDPSGCHALAKIFCEYQEKGIQLAISNPNPGVQRTLHLSGIAALVTSPWIFLRNHDAVRVCQAHMAAANVRSSQTRTSTRASSLASSFRDPTPEEPLPACAEETKDAARGQIWANQEVAAGQLESDTEGARQGYTRLSTEAARAVGKGTRLVMGLGGGDTDVDMMMGGARGDVVDVRDDVLGIRKGGVSTRDDVLGMGDALVAVRWDAERVKRDKIGMRDGGRGMESDVVDVQGDVVDANDDGPGMRTDVESGTSDRDTIGRSTRNQYLPNVDNRTYLLSEAPWKVPPNGRRVSMGEASIISDYFRHGRQDGLPERSVKHMAWSPERGPGQLPGEISVQGLSRTSSEPRGSPNLLIIGDTSRNPLEGSRNVPFGVSWMEE